MIQHQTLGRKPILLLVRPVLHLFFPLKASTNQTQARVLNSLHITNSNVDITAYATEMAQRMELAQSATEPEVLGTVRDVPELGCHPNSTPIQSSSGPIRTSTPTPRDQSTMGAYLSLNRSSEVLVPHRLSSLSYN